jgi:MYXO-CTERM domain-containing protein
VHVTDSAGNPIAGRTVHVEVSGDTSSAPTIDDLTTDAEGNASFRVTASAMPGTFTLTFTVEGSDAVTSAELTVDAIPTKTSVSYSGHYTLHASVDSDHGTPTGHVRFMIDDQEIGTAELDDTGMATLDYAGESGLEGIVAVYDAQDAFGQSRSTAISLNEPPGTGGGPETDAGPASAADGGTRHDPTLGWKLAGGSGHCAVSAAGARSSSGSAAWFVLAAAVLLIRRRRRVNPAS